jgi:hypothetical protein
LVVFGLAVLAESIGMPRFEERRINPWTIPGLVPGMLGMVIAIMGAAVALRSVIGGALQPRAQMSAEEAVEARAAIVRFSICAGLCLVYALALVGRAPFWVATGLFVFAFVAIFEWRPGDEMAPRLIKLAIAAALAIAAMLAIPYLFEHLFLVRLP